MCISINVAQQSHSPYHTNKHICYDSKHNLCMRSIFFFFFYNHLDTYQYLNFVLNYRSYYQIYISILMKYVLLMFLSHLFIFSYWTFSNLYVLFKRDIHSTKATFKSITTSITYECRVIKFIKIQINKNWSGCCSWSINQG